MWSESAKNGSSSSKGHVNHQTGNEIITIHIGQCGNYVGQRWLNGVLRQHHLDPDGAFNAGILDSYPKHYLTERLNSYFYVKVAECYHMDILGRELKVLSIITTYS